MEPAAASVADAEVVGRVDVGAEIGVEVLAEAGAPPVIASRAAGDADVAAALVEAGITNHRVAEAGPAKGAESEDDENLRRVFSANLIRPNRLNSPLKRLMWLAIIQIALVAVLMAAQKVHQPQVNSAVLDPAGGDFTVPLVMLVAMSVSVAAGYWFGLAGAFRVRTTVGVPVAALATWMLADYPIGLLRAGSTSTGRVSYAGLLWAQLVTLGVLWVWLGWVAATRWRTRTTGTAVQVDPDGEPWQRLVFLGTGGCVLAYYAFEFAIWVQFSRYGQTASGTGFLLNDFGLQAVLLPTFLVLVVLLGSTDLLEWGEITVRWAVLRLGRTWPPWLLVTVTSLAAIAILASVTQRDGVNVLLELAVIGIPAVLIAALVWLTPDYGGWSGDTRSRAVTTGAVVLFAYSTVLLSITSAVLGELGWPSRFDVRFYWLVATPVGLAALTAGVFILARGALGKEQRGQGLLLVIAAVVIIVAGLPGFLAAARLPAVFPARHFSLLNGLLFVAAAGTLIEITVLAVLGRLKSAGDLLANTFKLLIGLQLVQWLLDLLKEIAKLGANSTYLLAGLFFLTVMWGFATAGEKLTGTKANSAKYPRDGRILLTVSYTMVSSATLLYLGALHGPARAPAPTGFLTDDPATPLGLSVLGSALVIMAFVTGLARVPGGPARKVAVLKGFRARLRRPSVGTVQVGVAVAGTILTGASLAVVATGGLPDLARASAEQLGHTYTALVPGPNCDTGGANWFVAPGEPISTQCGRSGLLATVAAHRQGDVTFQPPDGFTSPNYRISVTVTFDGHFDGCVSIYTRSSAAGRYLNNLCSDNSAGINAVNINTKSVAQLAGGSARPAHSYTMMTVSDGTHQSLFINGFRISAVFNKEFPQTLDVGLALSNVGGTAAKATFSHFIFTPLLELPNN